MDPNQPSSNQFSPQAQYPNQVPIPPTAPPQSFAPTQQDIQNNLDSLYAAQGQGAGQPQPSFDQYPDIPQPTYAPPVPQAPEPAQTFQPQAPASPIAQIPQPQQYQQPAPAPSYPTPVPAAMPPIQLSQPTPQLTVAQSAVKDKVGQPTAPRTNPNSTQNSLMISEVRDNIAIINDGSFRAVIECQPVNFDLMSNQERESVEYAYQGFLNSLYFDVQIFIRSRKVDLRPYLEKLDRVRLEQSNMLLNVLMEDYINFMFDLSNETNIMDKRFYVVIPFYPVIDTKKLVKESRSFIVNAFGKKDQHVTITEPELEKAKTELKNRIQAVQSGLQQCGVVSKPLNTQELISLYYTAYNPDTANNQPLTNFDNVSEDVISKGQGVPEKDEEGRRVK